MSGTVGKDKKSSTIYVRWWDPKKKKQYKIYKYNGEKIGSKSTALKLLHNMQGDVEAGIFQIEKYIVAGWSDVLPMIEKWQEETFDDLKPATAKGYKSYLKNWILPFFKKNPVQLHDIQLDTLTALAKSINRSGKFKQNVLYCVHSFLDYCWRSRRIPSVPAFPKKKVYGVVEPVIRWLPEARQMSILEKIPEEHKPIFYFLKFTLRRPAEAMAIHREDVVEGPSGQVEGFTIHRSISARKLVDSSKTGAVHNIPCHDDLIPFILTARRGPVVSQFLFTCKTSRNAGKRYSHSILNRVWKAACKAAGEDIDLYSGLKHSSASQYINEKGLSESQLQTITDHARLDSVRRYAKTELAEKKRLLMAVPLPVKKKNQSK